MGDISKNFSYAEFERSATAGKFGIDNSMPAEVRAHVEELVSKLLQPLRDAWGSPLTVTSGYRCEALNKAVKGSATSAHVCGWAADLVPQNGTITEFFDFAERWLRYNSRQFDQCIREVNAAGTSRWLHLGLKNREGKQRRQFLALMANK
jgi:zinc D-Ala-D-Ala carboxypeptidase